MSGHLKTLVSGVAAVAIAQVALAQDLTISVDVSDLEPVLQQASLVATVLSTEETPLAQDLIAAARADYQRIIAGLYSEGYYGGAVSIRVDGREAASIAPLEAPETVAAISIEVNAGQRFTFGQVGVAPLADGTVLPEGFATGQPARSGDVKAAVAAAVAAWRADGHAKAAPSAQQITARHAEAELNVNIGIDAGPQVSFGPLTVSGNEDVRTDAITRIIGYREGTVFSPDDAEKVADRLRRTGAFSSVAVIEGDSLIGTAMPIELQVSEKLPRRLGYGIEMSTVDGLTLSGYWMHRNMMGGAHRLRVEGIVSGIAGETGGIDYATTFTYAYPRPFSIDTEAVATLTLEHEDEPDYKLDQVAGSIIVSRLFSDNRQIEGGIGFVTAQSEDANGHRDYTLLTLPMAGTVDRRDSTLNPKNGHYATLDLIPFVGFGDAGTGGRAYFDGRIYRSVGTDDTVTFALRGQLGSVMGVSIAEAPTDYLFYSGGGDSVRGEGYKSLGYTSGGQTTGGRSFAAISAETRVEVTPSIGVVGFMDAGFVGGGSVPFQDGEWQSGAGFGLRYNTGIGPIRLDLATPTSGDSAGQSVNLYVGIGQAF